MAELKDKDEQYNVFLQYKEKNEEDGNKMIITLRVVFIAFIMLALFWLCSFLLNNYSNIPTIIDGMTNKELAAVKIPEKKPDLTPSKFSFSSCLLIF